MIVIGKINDEGLGPVSWWNDEDSDESDESSDENQDGQEGNWMILTICKLDNPWACRHCWMLHFLIYLSRICCLCVATKISFEVRTMDLNYMIAICQMTASTVDIKVSVQTNLHKSVVWKTMVVWIFKQLYYYGSLGSTTRVNLTNLWCSFQNSWVCSIEECDLLSLCHTESDIPFYMFYRCSNDPVPDDLLQYKLSMSSSLVSRQWNFKNFLILCLVWKQSKGQGLW